MHTHQPQPRVKHESADLRQRAEPELSVDRLVSCALDAACALIASLWLEDVPIDLLLQPLDSFSKTLLL